MSIYVGEEDCIDLENGTKAYILHDLSQGADDDLWAYEIAQGLASAPGQRTFWTSKLLELAIVRVVEPDGEAYKPSLAQIRSMKAATTDRLREEVMLRWYPLAWQQLMELLKEPVEEATSGLPSTGSGDLAATPQNGSSASN